jgi:hypothetical protein
MLVRLTVLVLSMISLQIGGNIGEKVADALMDALRDGLPGIFKQLADIATGLAKGAIKSIAGPALDLVLYVPSPLPVGVYFQKPANSPWGAIFDYMWGATIPLGFALLFTAWAVGQAGSSLTILDERKTRKLDRGMFAGLLVIPLSYVLVAIFLQVVNALTAYIAPSPAEVSSSVFNLLTFDQLTGSASTLIIAFLLSNTLLVLILLAVAVNIFRVVMLLVISIVLPILMSLKLAGLPYLEDWADKFLNMFVSLGLSTVIVAAGLRLSLLLFGGGTIRLDGIPADNFIGPVFAMIPFALGVVMPAGSIISSLNISQVAGALTGAPAKLASGAASKASSKASSLASAGRKAGGERVASELKKEYSEKRRWGGPGDDELGDDLDVGQEFEDDYNAGPQTTLPETYNSGEGDLPDSAGGYSAGSADYSATQWGEVGPDESESEDDLLGVRSSTTDQSGDSAGDDRGSEASSESGDSGTQQSGSGATEDGEDATSSTGQQDTTDSSSDEESDGEATTDSSSTDSDEESSEETEDTQEPESTRTTVDRIANDPASIPDSEPIDLEQAEYHDKANVPGGGKGKFLRDADGNEVPVELSEDGPDLENGQTYDLSGAQVQENYLSEPDEELPNAVSNDVVDVTTGEQGRFQSVRVGSSTSVEQSAQSYGEDFKARAKARAKVSKGDVKSAAERIKQAPGNAKEKAANSVVDAADDALLTEDVRADLGKLPTEIREGTRVQTQHGSRVSTGQVTQTWTDDQTDTEMAAVQFDNQDDPTVVPKNELSLSASSPAGKTSSEGD